MATIVGGFGRFVKADATTRATTDLLAFRCQIVLDSVFYVPQNLSIMLGEVLYSVMVHLESWERIEDGGDGDPSIPPKNGPEEREMDEDETDINHHSDGEGDQAAVEEEMGAGTGEVEEGEVPEQTRAIRLASAVRQAELVQGGSSRLEVPQLSRTTPLALVGRLAELVRGGSSRFEDRASGFVLDEDAWGRS